MNYDLSIKEERKKFINRCNFLLKNQRTSVAVVDESNRTLNQNSYLHVICRILAVETGVTESYVKQVYFKRLANKELFIRATKDPLSNEMINVIRSTSELSVSEMAHAIDNFVAWAAEQGYYLPEASTENDGTMTFATDFDKDAFHQAEINTSKFEQYI